MASAVVLVGGSALALQHRPGSKPVVLVPQATTLVTCGQTITASVVVGNDLNCGSGNGLNVGAANIIVNLNGRTVTGPGTGIGYGIEGESFSGVTIENGTVSGWSTGVFAGNAAKVTGIRATANEVGIALTGTGASATGNVVFQNTGYGIAAQGVNDKVTSNVVRESSIDGIFVEAAGAVVQTNQSENNTRDGIRNSGTGTTLIGNLTNANANDGISNASDPTPTVASNTANYNGALGIDGSPGGKDGGGNKAKGNGDDTQCKDVVCS